MVSFTGSVSAGRDIAERCAKELKKCSLELGGKDAAIVCDDADVRLAARGIVWGAFTNAGQVCTAAERLIADRSIVEELLEAILKEVARLQIGRDIGPVISAAQIDRLSSLLRDAKRKGGKVVVGGRPVDRGRGFYFEPTVVTGVSPRMRIAQEETFGPILTVQSVRSDQEAIRAANDTCFGLGASIWTRDLNRGERLAKQLDSGMVWVNDVNIAFPECPWSGVKQSGRGVNLSKYGLHEFTALQHISLERSRKPRTWWFPYG